MNAAKAFAIISIFVSASIAQAEPVCVTTPKLNLRQAPSASAPITWTVGQHMPLLRVEKKGAWSQVQDVDGKSHWAMTSALTSKLSCAVIKTKSAKLRKQPNARVPAQFAVVDKYTPFRKIERDGEWLLVQDEYKGKYWVNETNVWIPVQKMRIAF